MPSIKEIYNSIGEVELNADSINLNVDGLEALASTQQADVAAIKTDIANGVTINQPVAVTDNNGSLTVDGSVSVSNFPATQPVSGTVTAAQTTAANLNATVVQGTATNLKTQAENYQGGSAVGSGNPLQVTLANTGANATAVKVDGTVTANGGNFASATTNAPSHSIQLGWNETLYGYGFRAVNNDGDELPVRPVGSIEVGTLPAISGTVTANAGSGTFNVSDRGATGEATVSNFTSTTSATLKSSNSNRKVLTIYNEGAGNLHVLYGSGTASTTNYSVKLFSGDYLEIDKYTGQVNAIFASAGTARVTEIT